MRTATKVPPGLTICYSIRSLSCKKVDAPPDPSSLITSFSGKSNSKSSLWIPWVRRKGKCTRTSSRRPGVPPLHFSFFHRDLGTRMNGNHWETRPFPLTKSACEMRMNLFTFGGIHKLPSAIAWDKTPRLNLVSIHGPPVQTSLPLALSSMILIPMSLTILSNEDPDFLGSASFDCSPGLLLFSGFRNFGFASLLSAGFSFASQYLKKAFRRCSSCGAISPENKAVYWACFGQGECTFQL